jgi:hypothetical protein
MYRFALNNEHVAVAFRATIAASKNDFGQITLEVGRNVMETQTACVHTTYCGRAGFEGRVDTEGRTGPVGLYRYLKAKGGTLKLL